MSFPYPYTTKKTKAMHSGQRPQAGRAVTVSIRVLAVAPRRIGTQLEFYDLGQSPLAALDVERRSVAEGRPQSLALPARMWIIDAPIHAFRVSMRCNKAGCVLLLPIGDDT